MQMNAQLMLCKYSVQILTPSFSQLKSKNVNLSITSSAVTRLKKSDHCVLLKSYYVFLKIQDLS